MRKVTLVVGGAAIMIVGMGAKGCGSTTVVNKSANTTKSETGSTTAAAVAHVGSTLALNSSGKKMNVTLLKVIDPAQGADQYTTPDAGKRFVGVELQLAGVTGTISGDANNDVAVVGSNNQTYTADFSPIASCTNFSSGSYTLTPGQTTTGCVTFQVPTGVTVVQVTDNPNLIGGTQGEWKVP